MTQGLERASSAYRSTTLGAHHREGRASCVDAVVGVDAAEGAAAQAALVLTAEDVLLEPAACALVVGQRQQDLPTAADTDRVNPQQDQLGLSEGA